MTITNVGKKYKLNLLIETKRKHILDPIQDEEFYSEVNEEFCSEVDENFCSEVDKENNE